MTFLDHFSDSASLYASIRPTYPRALFEFMTSIAPGHATAWDCATGNGQAAIGMAAHFDTVEATDASSEQIACALPAERVRYSVQPAENTNFAEASFDAVCVAQALHWFDTVKFFNEVRRVCKPRGILLVSGYNWLRVDAGFDAAFADAVLAPLLPSWPPQNALIWNEYRDVHFPFPPIDAPPFAIEVDWRFEQMLAFVHSWSGTRRHIANHGRAFFDDAEQRLLPFWGAPDAARRISMPLTVRAFRIDR